jgi:flagellar biosynthetic protein FliR
VVPLDSPLAFAAGRAAGRDRLAAGLCGALVFAAVEFAGEIIGLQMGLNFAGFFDPVTASQGTATSRFFGTMVAWLFIVGGGHLLVMAGAAAELRGLSGRPEPFAFLQRRAAAPLGREIFSPACGSRCR